MAAANILAGPLARGEDPDPLLARVQQRRARAVRWTQAMQKAAHDNVIEPLLARTEPITRPFPMLRLLDTVPLLRRLPGRLIGLGVDRQRIETPDAFG